MNTEIKYEIREYMQQIDFINFNWNDIVTGITMNCERFGNVDYEVLEEFKNKDDAKKAFEKYVSMVSDWYKACSTTYCEITEYEMAEVKYVYDEDGDLDEMEDLYCDISEFDSYTEFRKNHVESNIMDFDKFVNDWNDVLYWLDKEDIQFVEKNKVLMDISKIQHRLSKDDEEYYTASCKYKDDYEFEMYFAISKNELSDFGIN